MQDYKNTLVELFEYNAKIHANREAIFLKIMSTLMQKFSLRFKFKQPH